MKLSVSFVALLCIGLVNVVSGNTRDTLASFDPRTASVFYQEPGIRAQAARFDLAAPAYLHSVTLWLAGRTTGTATVRIYGNEGSFSAPLLSLPLSPAITVRKDRPNVQQVVVPLPAEFFVDRPQFFVVVEEMSDGVHLLSDRREQEPICADGGERWTHQSILGSDGIWRVGRYGYAVEVVVDYPDAFAPVNLVDVTAEMISPLREMSRKVRQRVSSSSEKKENTPLPPQGGIAWGDIDLDGRVDLLSNGRLWLNRGGEEEFEEITEQLNLDEDEAFTSGHFIDVDNDRDLDILLIGFDDGRTRLLLNDGRGNFDERGSPLSDVWNPSSLSIADADGDNNLDLYIVQGHDTSGRGKGVLYNRIKSGWSRISLEGDVRQGRTEGAISLAGDDLRSDSTTIAAQWLDYEGDGDLDLYLTGQTLDESRLLLNDGTGQLQLSGVTEQKPSATTIVATGIQTPALIHSRTHTLSNSDWSDVDNDGQPDLLQPINVGRANLNQITESELQATDFDLPTSFAGSGTWADVDNDGRLDLLITSSCDCRFATLYRQNEMGAFVEESFPYGLFRVPAGSDAVWVDWNNDGKLDLSTFVGGELKLYKNTLHNGNNFIGFDLEGSSNPSEVIGGVLHLYAGNRYQSRAIVSGRGALMQGPLRVHFGLAEVEKVDSVVISFANGGERIVVQNPAVNQYHRLYGGERGAGTGERVKAFKVSLNPFRDQLTFSYELGEKSEVVIEVHSLDGQVVGVVNVGESDRGTHAVQWKAVDSRGDLLPAGTYIWRATIGNTTKTGRAILVR